MFAIDKLAACIAQRVNLYDSMVILIEIEEIFARFTASGTHGRHVSFLNRLTVVFSLFPAKKNICFLDYIIRGTEIDPSAVSFVVRLVVFVGSSTA